MVSHTHMCTGACIKRLTPPPSGLLFPWVQVTPLTALKFAELSAKAGIPKGVINILPGSGSDLPPLMTLRVQKLQFLELLKAADPSDLPRAQAVWWDSVCLSTRTSVSWVSPAPRPSASRS